MKLGNDIIEIDRIRCAIEKSKPFRDRVYTSHEIDYCESKKKGVMRLMLAYMVLKRLSLKH